MTKQAKKKTESKKVTTGKKAKPQVTNKIVIRDACAADGCTKEPIKGSSYCAEHRDLAKADVAKLNKVVDAFNTGVAKAAKQAQVRAYANPRDHFSRAEIKRAKTPKADPVVTRELAKLIQGEAKKPAPVAVVTEPPRDATEAIKALQANGWTLNTIAAAVETSPGRVWFWAHGKTCRRINDILSLTFKTPPRKDVVASGSRTVKAAVSAKSVRERPTDSRQMLLDLRTAINAVLRAS